MVTTIWEVRLLGTLREAVHALVIRDNRVLIVQKRDAWILPGGKPEKGENDFICLSREFREELPDLRVKLITGYLGPITGQTPHRGDQLVSRVYLVDVEGSSGHAAELTGSVWTDRPEDYPLSDITERTILAARQRGYLV